MIKATKETTIYCKNIRFFKYKSKKYILAETVRDIENLHGAYKKIGDTQVCIINSFLPKDQKLLTIHRLIKNRKCRAL